jgi:hypothetical protein
VAALAIGVLLMHGTHSAFADERDLRLING